MAEILFLYNGKEILQKCLKDEKMREIISRFISLAQTIIDNKIFMYNGRNITYDQDLSFSEIINSFDRPKNRMTILVYDIIYKDKDNNCNINFDSKNEGNNVKKEDKYSILLNKINVLENRLNKLEEDKKSEIDEKNSIYMKYKELEEKYINQNNIIKNVEKEINNIKELIKKIEDNKYFLNKLNLNLNSALNQNALIKNINNDITIFNKKTKDNFITIKLNIEKNDIGKEIRYLSQCLLSNSIIHNFEINDIEVIIDDFTQKKRYKYINSCSCGTINCKLQNSFYFYHIFNEEGYHSIKVIFNKKISSCTSLFKDCNNIYEIDFSNFDGSQLEGCSCMFYNCTNLKKINFGSFSFSLCEDFSFMFYQCKNLFYEFDLSNFDTENSKSFSSMFYGCKNILSLDLSNFDTKNSKSFSSMFYGCSSLIYINLSSFDTSSCENISNMFYGCENIKEIDMIEWDTSKLKKFGENSNGLQGLFNGCKKLENIKMNFNFRYFSNVIFYSELPQDGTFTYKIGKNNGYGRSIHILLDRLPKNWKKIKEE